MLTGYTPSIRWRYGQCDAAGQMPKIFASSGANTTYLRGKS